MILSRQYLRFLICPTTDEPYHLTKDPRGNRVFGNEPVTENDVLLCFLFSHGSRPSIKHGKTSRKWEVQKGFVTSSNGPLLFVHFFQFRISINNTMNGKELLFLIALLHNHKHGEGFVSWPEKAYHGSRFGKFHCRCKQEPLLQSSQSDDFGDRLAELQEAGGDAFFLQNDEKEANDDSDNSGDDDERIAEIMATGGDPFFLMDETPANDPIVGTSSAVSSSDAPDDVEDALSADSILAMMTMSSSAGGDGVMDLVQKSSMESEEMPVSLESFEKIKAPGKLEESYDDRISEVVEAGGDPFFLSKDEKEDLQHGSFGDRISEIEDMGGDSFFLSDKKEETVEATNNEDDGEENVALSPDAFMAMALAAGGSGGVTDLIKGTPPPAAPSIAENSSYDNAIEAAGGDASFRNAEDLDDQLSEIEAMGGDPFFLSDEDEDSTDDPSVPNETTMSGGGIVDMIGQEVENEEDPNEGVWEWDGIVDEEAHLGFD